MKYINTAVENIRTNDSKTASVETGSVALMSAPKVSASARESEVEAPSAPSPQSERPMIAVDTAVPIKANARICQN